MTTINVNRLGLALGTLAAGWHLIWALLVAIGFAQKILDFVFWMHFIQPVYVVGPFHAGTAVILIAVTGVAGYLVGCFFAAVWNTVQKT